MIISTLLCIQLREQLGYPHAAGVFVNEMFDKHFSIVFGIAEAIGIPQGTIYINKGKTKGTNINPEYFLAGVSFPSEANQISLVHKCFVSNILSIFYDFLNIG